MSSSTRAMKPHFAIVDHAELFASPESVLREVRYVSFDFFDTLMLRPGTFAPTDVFLKMSQIVDADQVGMTQAGLASLAKRREHAEAVCRRRAHANGFEEVTIDEIHLELARLCRRPAEAAALFQAAELQAESELLSMNPAILPLLEMCDRFAVSKLIVSDTYFDGATIVSFLDGADEHSFNRVLTSAETRLTKFSGGLFETLLSQLDCRPEQILHVGDHPHSDVAVPARYAIRSLLVPSESRARRRYLGGYEAATGSTLISRLLAKAKVPSASSTAEPASIDELEELGRANLAVLYLGFAIWILNELEHREIRRAFFLARDGWIVEQVLGLLLQYFPDDVDVETRYVHVSRASLYPTLFHTSPIEAAAHFSRSWEDLTVAELVNRLPVSASIGFAVFAEHGMVDPSQDVRERKLEAEAAVQELIPDLVAASRDANQAAVQYLTQEGLLDDDEMAIVDIGWHGSLQNCLEKLRVAHGLGDRPLCGLYLGTRVCPPEMANHMASFLLNCGYPSETEAIVDASPSMIELMHAAPHGTTTGYRVEDGRVVAELDDCGEESVSYDEIVAPMQRAALELISEVLAESDGAHEVGVPDPKLIAQIGLRFITSPTVSEALRLSELTFAADVGASVRPLLCEEDMRDTIDEAHVIRWHPGRRTLINARASGRFETQLGGKR